MTPFVLAAVIAALMFASYWLAVVIGPKVGVQVRDANVAKQRILWLMLLYEPSCV
jgi:hypothetical protein